jgi:hypothetical protein
MAKTKNEIDNDSVIPAEMKEQLTQKVQGVLSNIGSLEAAINSAIDDVVEGSETPITATEINAALWNVLKKMNQQEIMQIIK